MIPLGLDTETALIRPGRQAPPLACMSLWFGDSGGLISRWEAVEAFERLIAEPTIQIVGQGVAYDMVIMCNEAPHLQRLIFDAYEADRIACTEVRQKLLDTAAGVYRSVTDLDEDGAMVASQYNLEDLSWRLLRRRLDKNTWRLRYGELIDIPISEWPEGARVYPIEDARAALDVFGVQETALPYLEDQYRQSRAAFWLKLMSAWGIRTDLQGVRDLARNTARDFEVIATDLRSIGWLRPDRKVKRRETGLIETVPGSRDTKKVQARIVEAYTKLGQDYPKTDTGLPQADKQACADSGDPDLEKYGRLGILKAVLSKDLPLLEAGIYLPIHSHYEVLKETGRTGSSSPNLQNLRRASGIRECFVPRCHECGAANGPEGVRGSLCGSCGGPASVFIETDFGGLELFTLAETCFTVLGYSALGEALNAKVDPHLLIAESLLNEPGQWPFPIAPTYENLKRIRKTYDHKSPEYHLMDQARQTGKVANFGFPGGLGAPALCSFALSQYQVRITVDQAKALKRIWLSRFPEMRQFFKWVDSQVTANPPLIRHLFSNRFRGGVGYTDGCNSFFQGLGSDVAKAAVWLVTRACYVEQDSPLWGFRPVLFVHDSIMTEGPEHRAHEAAIEQSRLMVLGAKPWLPHLREIDAEPEMMRRYSKDAKAIYENGRLVPWAA